MERQQQTDLAGVHKITKQVKSGWKVDMRETTRNSRETTRDKIEAQGKGGANARYGKQQLKESVTGIQMVQNSYNKSRQNTRNGKGTQRPHSDTNVHHQPEPTHSSTPTSMAPSTQHNERTHNKKNQKKTKTKEEGMRRRRHRLAHNIGNVEEVCAHRPEGLRTQLKQWEAEAEEMRYEGDVPTLLLGSEASTLSEDPHAAVAGAWLAIGVFTTRELQSKDMKKWRGRIKWKKIIGKLTEEQKCVGARKKTEQ